MGPHGEREKEMAKKKQGDPVAEAVEAVAAAEAAGEKLPTALEQGPIADIEDDGVPAEPPTVDGTEPEEANTAPPADTAEERMRLESYHAGFEAALRQYAHVVDGMHFIGGRGTTLAEALEANDQRHRSAVASLVASEKGQG
jgi:hypothetical protein